MNNIVLTGRLTKDPELRYIPESQRAVASFTLAVDRPFAKDKADFIKITVFEKQAENCERFLTKGKLCGVQGRLQTGSYKNKDGQTVYTTDVVADRVEFLEWGEAKQNGFNYEDENQDVTQKPKSKKPPDIPEGFAAVDDSDIPF
jgi:single-strand DNA-binding protein